ncbi:MAG: T9SS type A sorting domain-containing protein [Bacteroidia bacterium]
MYKHLLRLLAVLSLAVFSVPSAGQISPELIAYWNQNSNEIQPGVFGFTAASFPQAADSGVGNIMLTNFLTDTNLNGAYTFVPSFAGTTINALGVDLAGGSLSIQAGTNLGNNGANLDMQISMTGREELILSYATRRTSSGFSSQAYSYSTDGINFVPFGVDNNINTSTFESKSVNFSSAMALADAPNVTIRITIDGATTSTGNVRFDNIQLNATPLAQNSINAVTFRVDMQNETVSPLGVHIAGSFQGWNPGATPMVQDASNPNIWTYTDTFLVGNQIEYKFINGNSWGNDELVFGSCAAGPGNTNRALTIPSTNTVLPAVCFASCSPCASPVDVTFRVDMRNQTVRAQGVHVAGSFQGWNPSGSPMVQSASDSNIWTYTASIIPGNQIAYKFINGNDWGLFDTITNTYIDWSEQLQFLPCVIGGDRELTVPSSALVLPAVLFGECNEFQSVVTPSLPVVPIATLRSIDSLGVADSLGARVAVHGTVVSHNIRLSGMQYVINDGTGGITIYRGTGNFGLGQLQLGDSLWAEGTVDQFRGLTQLIVDTVVVLGTGTVPMPVLVSVLSESTESELVRLNDLQLVSGTWPAAGSTSSGVNLTVESIHNPGQTFTVRVVPNSTDLGGNGPTTPVFDLIGVGGQFESNSPFIGGYQLFPRSASDVINHAPATTVNVTFRVDMRNETVRPQGVHIAGSFQGWNASSTPMVQTAVDPNIWVYTASLNAGDHIEYKFINGDDWGVMDTTANMYVQWSEQIQGLPCAPNGNRSLLIPGSAVVLPAVLFGECNEFGANPGFTLPITWDDPNVNYVFTDFGGNVSMLAPSPTDSNNTTLRTEKQIGAASWAGTTITPSTGLSLPIPFAPGATTISVKVYAPASGIPVRLKTELATDPTISVETEATTVNSGWQTLVFDFNNQSMFTAPINFAHTYNMLSIFYDFGNVGTGAVFYADSVYFGGNQSPQPGAVNITFMVDIGSRLPGPGGVRIAGNFQGWNPSGPGNEMMPMGGNVYGITLPLNPGDSVQYKFLTDNFWGTDELVPLYCGFDDGGGFSNRLLVVPAFDDTLATVPFGGCNIRTGNLMVSGLLYYDNASQSPMSNTLMELYSLGYFIDAQTTTASGQYMFSNLAEGDYELKPVITKPWGGVNATDALNTARHFSGMITLNPLASLAADVNVSGNINSTDALLIARRYVAQINSFDAGDWAYFTPIFNLSAPHQLVTPVLCYGDVNASYNPSPLRVRNGVALMQEQPLPAALPQRQYPVSMHNNQKLGALSLKLGIPVGMQVLDVISQLPGEFLWHVEGQVLAISWFSLNEQLMSAGDELFSIVVSNNGATTNWELLAEAEMANGWAEVIADAAIRMPAVRASVPAAFDAIVYPNPAAHEAQLKLSLPADARLSYEIYDLTGRLVVRQLPQMQLAGTQVLTLDLQQLRSGQYLLRIQADIEGQLLHQQLRLQLVK